MSDPTQPDGINPNDPEGSHTGPADSPTPDSKTVTGHADEPMKAQAYVDPSIAAEAQLATLEAENAELKDRFVRAHAEMDNLRKRTEREKADTSKYAISKFAGDMLAVADNLQRALAAFAESGSEPDPHTKALVEGVELIDGDLKKALERHGVTKIEALGTIFDPNFHQAVMEEENKDIAAGTVLRVFQEGYKIGNRVLRPTMVVVARGGFKLVPTAPEAPSPAGPPANDDAPPDVDSASENPQKTPDGDHTA